MLKKIISLLLAVSITMSLTTTSLASVNNTDNQEIFDTVGTPMVEIKLNPQNLSEVENILKEHKIEGQEAADIREYVNLSQRGLLESPELSIYVPNNKLKGQYRGFNNKYYYENIVHMKATSGSKILYSGTNLSNYMKGTASAVITYIVDGVISSTVGAIWSIATLFFNIPSNAAITTPFRHEARLVEEKWTKYTYYMEGSEKYLGSTIDKVQSHFQNIVVVAGSNSYTQNNTPVFNWTGSSWNDADKKAYYNWPIGGYNEQISDYRYKGVDFATL